MYIVLKRNALLLPILQERIHTGEKPYYCKYWKKEFIQKVKSPLINIKKMLEWPIVVVLSESMEPAFHRGDLLFLTNYKQEDIRIGDDIVQFMTTQSHLKCIQCKAGTKQFDI